MVNLLIWNGITSTEKTCQTDDDQDNEVVNLEGCKMTCHKHFG